MVSTRPIAGSSASPAVGPLAPYRVQDCCDGRGALAGALLAQLGAEVLRRQTGVEPAEQSTISAPATRSRSSRSGPA